jgi:Transglutaminase-like superfamily
MSPSDATLRERAWLVAEVLVTYGMVRWSVRRRDLPTVVAALRRPRRRLAARGALDADERRLAGAAVRVLERVPGDSRCLTRSLVVLAMLARRGRDVRLVLAARPAPTFAAHAWVERDGRPLLPTRDFDDARLAEL